MEIGKISTAQHISQSVALVVASKMAQHSLHPVSRALVHASQTQLADEAQIAVSNVQEISGFGLVADASLGKLKLGSAKFCEITDEVLQSLQKPAESEQSSVVYLVANQVWLATFEVIEAVKEDAANAVSALQSLGLGVEVLSGDKLQSVARIANLVGISQVNGGCTPQEKLQRLQFLQQQGRQVAMVGDGLNDGPVLAAAHVSIAMGQAVPLAQSQSDFVIMSGELNLSLIHI